MVLHPDLADKVDWAFKMNATSMYPAIVELLYYFERTFHSLFLQLSCSSFFQCCIHMNIGSISNLLNVPYICRLL